MFDNYEKFKKDVYALTKIDLNYYKEKQMRRRIDTIATKHGCSNYDEYIRVLKTDKDKFEAFVNFLTINVSEFYRNPDQWKLMDENVIPKLIKQHGKNLMRLDHLLSKEEKSREFLLLSIVGLSSNQSFWWRCA